MSDQSKRPDLGRANGKASDRYGRPIGHTPADHAELRQKIAQPAGPDHADPTEKARPHDTGRSGA